MRYQSTVFGQLLKEVPRGWFERMSGTHARGRKKRCLSDWGHLVAMVLVQLAGLRSLRELECSLQRHPGVLAHLGLPALCRSTLSDANAMRPSALFEAVAAKLAAQVGSHGCGQQALRLIDATRIFAGRRMAHWSGCGIKLHVTFDPVLERPVCFVVTPERINDITVAQTMPIEPGATYVFDKGFYDFAFWARLAGRGCRFVTRLKKNSPTCLLHESAVDGEGVLFDRCVRLSERLSGQRRNPFVHPVRIIGVRIDGGGEITLLTNDLQAPAAEIAALYKARWQIELFFKWIKQNLKIAHFLGSSRNAVTIQIMAALIAYLLLRLAQLRHAAPISLQALARLMPATVLTRRTLAALFNPPDKPPALPPITQPQLPLVHA